MHGERVVDASVIAAALFLEAFSDEARRFLIETQGLFAPDHLHAEIASVAAKKVWRGETSEEVGLRACQAVSELGVVTTPSSALTERAFALATRHRFSVYDGLYLALGEQRSIPVYTFDAALVRKAVAAGMHELVDGPASLLGRGPG